MLFTLTEFEDLNLYSNRSMEKVVASLVNKSSNACLVSMFEDSVILLDHEDGQFYIADYNFDRETLTLKLENFDPVELNESSGKFEDNVQEFFENENVSALDLAESYKSNVIEQEKALKELINDAMSKKNFDGIINYEEIKEAKDSVVTESQNESFFQKYVDRIEKYPLTEIKYFNWEDSVSVSLFETETTKLVNSSAIEKAKDLWKRTDFKESFNEACKAFIENVEEGADLFKELFEEFPQVFFLEKSDRRTMFGKAVINSNELREDMGDILKGITLLFEKFDLKELKEQYLLEQDEEAVSAETPDEEPTAEEPVEKAPELSSDELKKIADDLKKVAEKIEDENTKEKLDGIIEKLTKGMEEGTRPVVVKEAVSILML